MKKVYSLQCSRSSGKIQVGARLLFNSLAGIVYSAIVLLMLFTVHCSLCTAFAQPISSTELINNAKQYDGKIVTYAGEVIGDVMARGDYAWINLNDSQNAIGVWIDRNLTKDIIYTGSYRSKGDWVEITGIFHRACLQHGGDLDIHAKTIKKIIPGRALNEQLNLGKRNLVLILFAILVIVWILRVLRQT
jgi:hypothetical protein